MKFFPRMLEKLYKVMIWLSLLIIVALIIVVSTNVISRYFFHKSFAWSDEVSIFLLAWVSMISIAVGVELKLHISLSFLVDKFPENLQKYIRYMGIILTFMFGLVFLFYGFWIVKSGWKATLPATKLPSSTGYLFVPVSGAMIILSTIKMLLYPNLSLNLDSYFGGEIKNE